VVTIVVCTRKLIEHSLLAMLDPGINPRAQNVGAYMSGVACDLLSAADAVSPPACCLLFSCFDDLHLNVHK
jgi:hypothetical protein